jgi:hypothetical protein
VRRGGVASVFISGGEPFSATGWEQVFSVVSLALLVTPSIALLLP